MEALNKGKPTKGSIDFGWELCLNLEEQQNKGLGYHHHYIPSQHCAGA
jgi:hypothetical protein